MHAPWHPDAGLHAWVVLTNGTSNRLVAAAASWRRVVRGSGCTGEQATPCSSTCRTGALVRRARHVRQDDADSKS